MRNVAFDAYRKSFEVPERRAIFVSRPLHSHLKACTLNPINSGWRDQLTSEG